MSKYIQIDIETIQPLKMGGTGSQSNYESALDYIAGSSIRGALINRWLNKQPNASFDLDKSARKQWLGGGVRVLNGYLNVEEQRTSPFPSSLYTSKESQKLFSSSHKMPSVINMLDINAADKLTSDAKRLASKGFVIQQGDNLSLFNVKLQSKLHININNNSNNQTQLYQYEAIESGQVFTSYIVVDEWTEQLSQFFYALKGEYISLGGSKSNGYGKCLVKNVTFLDNNPEQIEEALDAQTLYVYCLSDVIVRNEQGQLTTVIPDTFLSKLLDNEIKFESSSVQTITVSAFNQKWGSRVPMVEAIKKGSVFRYRAKAPINVDKLESILDLGIGERREDGYGRIRIQSKFSINSITKGKIHHLPIKSNIQSTTNQSALTQFIDNNKNIIEFQSNDIYRRILLQRLDQVKAQTILEWSKQTKDSRLSDSFYGRWMGVVALFQQLSPTSGKEKMATFITNLTKGKFIYPDETEPRERTNQKLYNNLQDSSIKNKPWIAFMVDYVNAADDVKKFINLLGVKLPHTIENQLEKLISKQEIYTYAMRLLYEYSSEHRRLNSQKKKMNS